MGIREQQHYVPAVEGKKKKKKVKTDLSSLSRNKHGVQCSPAPPQAPLKVMPAFVQESLLVDDSSPRRAMMVVVMRRQETRE